MKPMILLRDVPAEVVSCEPRTVEGATHSPIVILPYDQFMGSMAAAAAVRIGELEARIAAVKALHAPFALYDECGHDHTDDEPGVISVEDVGLVCEAGRTGTVCWHCDTDDGEVREDCWDATYPCETLRALGVE